METVTLRVHSPTTVLKSRENWNMLCGHAPCRVYDLKEIHEIACNSYLNEVRRKVTEMLDCSHVFTILVIVLQPRFKSVKCRNSEVIHLARVRLPERIQYKSQCQTKRHTIPTSTWKQEHRLHIREMCEVYLQTHWHLQVKLLNFHLIFLTSELSSLNIQFPRPKLTPI